MERDLWLVVSEVVGRTPCGMPPRCRFSNASIVLTFLWAVLHDRPVSWACRRESWPIHLRWRELPTPSTMCRRLRTPSVRAALDACERRLALRLPVHGRIAVIDSKPLTIGGNSGDPDAGFGRAAGGMGKGDRLHAIVALCGTILSWEVHPINVDQRAVAPALIERVSGIDTLPGDANYDSNLLYDFTDERGITLLTHRRGAGSKPGHRPQSLARLSAIAWLEHAESDWARRTLERRDRTVAAAGVGAPTPPRALVGPRQADLLRGPQDPPRATHGRLMQKPREPRARKCIHIYGCRGTARRPPGVGRSTREARPTRVDLPAPPASSTPPIL